MTWAACLYSYMMNRFIQDLMPQLHKFLVKLAVENLSAEPNVAASLVLMTFLPPWFNNMFGRFQPHIVMRMWDIFLLEGPKVSPA